MTLQFPATPEASLIKGGSGCGKTQILIDRIAEKLEAGTPAQDIAVFASTPDAAVELKRRLEEADDRADGIAVTTMRAFAMEALDTREAFEATGRRARLVQPFQLAFIMEDMKVSGLKARRLKEMLKFFYRSWTELTDDDPDFLITNEEQSIHRLIKEELAFTQAILEPELSALTLRYLSDHADALAETQVEHVFVDDYQQFSRASQMLANLIARSSVTVAADPLACIEVFESYPYVEGIDEFCAANEPSVTELDVDHRCAASTAVANVLRAELDDRAHPLTASDDAPAGDSFNVAEYASVKSEFDGVRDAVMRCLDAGIPAHGIYILTFNRMWHKQLVKALRAADIPVDSPLNARLNNGDYRDFERCAGPRLMTALALCADPDDALAWRCWCGYGDYLAHSASLAALRAWCGEEGIGLVEGLGRLAAMDDAAALALVPGCTAPVENYRLGLRVIEAADGKTGEELLRAICSAMWDVIGDTQRAEACDVPAEVSALVIDETQTADGEDAARLCHRGMARMDFPAFEGGTDAVRIGDGTHLPGQNPDVLLVSGFVNGFIPTRDYFDGTVTTIDKAAKIHLDDTRFLYVCLTKALRELDFSYFTSIDLESAERLRLSVKRIRLSKGVRVAAIAPSEFLEVIKPD